MVYNTLTGGSGKACVPVCVTFYVCFLVVFCAQSIIKHPTKESICVQGGSRWQVHKRRQVAAEAADFIWVLMSLKNISFLFFWMLVSLKIISYPCYAFLGLINTTDRQMANSQ